mmetsp:Transcript_4535/g.9253  ORF Transcript_4535/g.9253 Transcript_4535/m.9253 type:complete len:293 (+) Transcript_4535:47-925(+)
MSTVKAQLCIVPDAHNMSRPVIFPTVARSAGDPKGTGRGANISTKAAQPKLTSSRTYQLSRTPTRLRKLTGTFKCGKLRDSTCREINAGPCLTASRGHRNVKQLAVKCSSSESTQVAPRSLKVVISTGDVMGDTHAASLVKSLYKYGLAANVEVEVSALGGNLVSTAGAKLLGDNTGMSSIGLLEALPLVIPSLQLQQQVRAKLKENPPDVAVLIDYPGVNIPFGRYLRNKMGTQVVYYIPPNEWLWNTSRTQTICEMSDVVLCNYKDEADYFERVGANVSLVGHPLVDLAE